MSQKEIEVTIEQLQQHVDLKDAAIKLESNRHFQKLILNTYLLQYPADQVSLLTHPGIEREVVIRTLDGIAVFRDFMKSVIQQGFAAERSIKQHKEVLASIENGTAYEANADELED